MHECAPQNLPCFVAKNLNKLPPIAMKHVDFSAMISENMQIKYENKELQALCRETTMHCERVASSMRDAFVSQMERFKADLPAMVRAIMSDEVQRPAPKLTDASEVAAIDHSTETMSRSLPSQGDGIVRPKMNLSAQMSRMSPNLSLDDDIIDMTDDLALGAPLRGHSQRSNTHHPLSYAAMTAESADYPQLPSVTDPNRGPTPYRQQVVPPSPTVMNRGGVPPTGIPPLEPAEIRPKGRGQRGATIGTGQYSGLKAAEGANSAQVFVSRLHPSTQMENVVRHLNALGITVTDAEEIIPSNIKKGYVIEKTHCSFRFEVPSHMFWDVKKASVWPAGVLVKRYTPAKNGNQNN